MLKEHDVEAIQETAGQLGIDEGHDLSEGAEALLG